MSAPRSRGLVWALLKIGDPLRIGALNPGGNGAHVGTALLCPRKRKQPRLHVHVVSRGKMSRYNSEKKTQEAKDRVC